MLAADVELLLAGRIPTGLLSLPLDPGLLFPAQTGGSAAIAGLNTARAPCRSLASVLSKNERKNG